MANLDELLLRRREWSGLHPWTSPTAAFGHKHRILPKKCDVLIIVMWDKKINDFLPYDAFYT
jgi:hypothetical protein